jgi:hypothetical protein
MKRLGISLLALLALIIVSGPAVYFWDLERNRGFTWGYYAEFNIVSNVLAEMPNVTITNSYLYEDVSLELFSFDLLVSGKPVHLRFPQNDPIRKLRKSTLTNSLAKLIEEEKAKP